MRCAQPGLIAGTVAYRSRAVTFCAIAVCCGITACSDSRERVYLIGTSRPDTAFADLGAALRDVVNRSQQVQIETVSSKGSVENLERLRSGDIDFGLVQGGLAFEDSHLRSVASVDIEYLHVIVPRNSSLREFRDLAGKRVATGERGYGSYALVESILQAASLQPPVELVQRSTLADAFSGADIDAAMFVVSLRREPSTLLGDGNYRFIPVNHARAMSVDLFDVRIAEIPAGAYGPNLSVPAQAVPTLAVDTNIVVRAEVPDAVVERLTEALFSYEVRRQARLPALNEAAARSSADLELHPGAASYYSRNAPMSADQFEIAAFGLAALMTFLSAVRWLVMWLRDRKLRVNQRAISDILQAIGDNAADAQVTGTRDRGIADLLREAQRRWQAGQIDDEELRMIYDAASAYMGHRSGIPPDEL